MNNKWYKFLAEATRDFFDRNVGLIYHTAINNPRKDENKTLTIIDEFSQEQFEDLLFESRMDDILKEFQLDKIIGTGAMGVVYSLKYPHENYVFKFQLTTENDLIDVGGEVGTEYPTHLYSKQEKDEFDPKEMRVLDSIKNFAHDIKGESILISGIVMSKLSNVGESGITTDQIMEDVRKTRIRWILMNIVDYHNNRNYMARERVKSKFSEYHKDDVQTFMDLIDARKYEELFKIIYELNKTHGTIKHMDEKQYVSLALQLFKVMNEAFIKKGSHAALDLHSGNFGFRPNSDDVMFFDI